MATKKIRVLVVDDSALVRQILVEVLNAAPDVEVVGTASDPFMARDRIKELNPDVLTLDVEMPRMDGLTFLANLMRLRPMPVVMVSSLTEQGADTTLKALELGAIDFVSKPKIDLAGTLADFGGEILAKIRIAAGARVMARSAPVAAARVAPKYSADAVLPAQRGRQDAAYHRPHHRHRRVHGWNGSDPRSPHGTAGRLPGHRDRAAHSGSIQPAVHAAHGFAGRDVGGRAGRRPVHHARPRLHRAGQQALC